MPWSVLYGQYLKMEGMHNPFTTLSQETGFSTYFIICQVPWRLIAHQHLLVHATSEWFLLAWATFRDGLASESHWLHPVLVHIVHWWPAPVSVGGLREPLDKHPNLQHLFCRWFHRDYFYNFWANGTCHYQWMIFFSFYLFIYLFSKWSLWEGGLASSYGWQYLCCIQPG